MNMYGPATIQLFGFRQCCSNQVYGQEAFYRRKITMEGREPIEGYGRA